MCKNNVHVVSNDYNIHIQLGQRHERIPNTETDRGIEREPKQRTQRASRETHVKNHVFFSTKSSLNHQKIWLVCMESWRCEYFLGVCAEWQPPRNCGCFVAWNYMLVASICDEWTIHILFSLNLWRQYHVICSILSWSPPSHHNSHSSSVFVVVFAWCVAIIDHC